MGSPTDEEGRFDVETQHRVTLTKGFWMGETEVTQGLWKKLMGGNNPSDFKSGDEYPVERITWDDCKEFLRALNRACPVEGHRWWFPTEAQWEYACRAGSETPYFWGSALNGDKANCAGNHPCGTTTKGLYKGTTTKVGSYAANAWGLYDMHGNVREFCADRYGSYPGGAVTDPRGPVTASGYSWERVCRGGSWLDSARACRSASRSKGGGTVSGRTGTQGFRVALVPVQ